MEPKKRAVLIGALSGAFGGILGAVSGSRNLFVVAAVGGIFAALIAWGISGMVK